MYIYFQLLVVDLNLIYYKYKNGKYIIYYKDVNENCVYFLLLVVQTLEQYLQIMDLCRMYIFKGYFNKVYFVNQYFCKYLSVFVKFQLILVLNMDILQFINLIYRIEDVRIEKLEFIFEGQAKFLQQEVIKFIVLQDVLIQGFLTIIGLCFIFLLAYKQQMLFRLNGSFQLFYILRFFKRIQWFFKKWRFIRYLLFAICQLLTMGKNFIQTLVVIRYLLNSFTFPQI
eukprot:TRINITY_DN1983_c0_g1_i11.p3 TRINITY_DN1983_c0_g1~~TRINITY_DN1983_c0_g1_i11.p3  ORF type:complete len:227 (-),score=-7.22 TRINITY_DN1983_c0_g1_i11:1897-2577(-)